MNDRRRFLIRSAGGLSALAAPPLIAADGTVLGGHALVAVNTSKHFVAVAGKLMVVSARASSW